MKWQWSGEEGMDLHEALRAACKLLGKVNSYLEIGVDGGGSLNTVLCEGVPSRIVLCDIWNPDYCSHGDVKHRVIEILQYFEASALFLDGDSKVRVPLITHTFDLVLVDGDHSAEGATADLKNAWPRVKRGGILVMDDVHHPNYPWLENVWKTTSATWLIKPIEEEHGGCNAVMVMKA